MMTRTTFRCNSEVPHRPCKVYKMYVHSANKCNRTTEISSHALKYV